MSALAQYLAQQGYKVSGSDRMLENFLLSPTAPIFKKLGIEVHPQNAKGLQPDASVVVKSTAIEEDHIEIARAMEYQIPIISRSDLLALLSNKKKSIAIGGTSGKSSVCAMLFEILETAGLSPSFINGANLNRLTNMGEPGNCAYGHGDYLIFEADESDGSIVKYRPYLSMLLNIQKDHQEIPQLLPLFQEFMNHSQTFAVWNKEDLEIPKLQIPARLKSLHYSLNNIYTGYHNLAVEDTCLLGWGSSFSINHIGFELKVPGEFNMQNALAAICAAQALGVSLEHCAKALSNYEGIERRLYKVGEKKGVWVLDDFAHNPAKVEACLKAVLQLKNSSPDFKRVIAIFHPHGFAPMKLMGDELCQIFADILSTEDRVWFPEIYYAGGTAQKDISSKDLITKINGLSPIGEFFENKEAILQQASNFAQKGDIFISMGARDPKLGQFAQNLLSSLP